MTITCKTCKMKNYFSCRIPIAGCDNADIDSFICHVNPFQLQGNIPCVWYLFRKHNPVLVSLSKYFLISDSCVLVDVLHMIIKTFFPLNVYVLWLHPKRNAAWQGHILAHVIIEVWRVFGCKISWKNPLHFFKMLKYFNIMCDAETLPQTLDLVVSTSWIWNEVFPFQILPAWRAGIR